MDGKNTYGFPLFRVFIRHSPLWEGIFYDRKIDKGANYILLPKWGKPQGTSIISSQTRIVVTYFAKITATLNVFLIIFEDSWFEINLLYY